MQVTVLSKIKGQIGVAKSQITKRIKSKKEEDYCSPSLYTQITDL